MAKLATVGRYLKYTDIPDTEDTILTIDHAEQVKFEQDGKPTETKWVLFFGETTQGLVLNKTNTSAVLKATGVSDTDDLPGKKIAIYVKDDIENKGEIVSGIRVRPKAVK